MGKFDRVYQKQGDFTPLEISEKAYHDEMVKFLQAQSSLAEKQEEYAESVKRSTFYMMIATAVIAIAAIIQAIVLLSGKS